MALIIDSELDGLRDILNERKAYFYHACQLADFMTYMALGKLPSRKRLSQRPHSRFRTDSADQDNDVWDKVFVNLEDFGRMFTSGSRATPNVYGPILFVLKPRILDQCYDAAVCLRSAAARDFGREAHGLTLEGIDNLFVTSRKRPVGSLSALKTKFDLREEFGDDSLSPAEISLSCESDWLDLTDRNVVEIVVDPYVFGDVSLVVAVRRICAVYGFASLVKERAISSAVRKAILQDLGDFLFEIRLYPKDVYKKLLVSKTVKAETKDWARSLSSFVVTIFDDYCRYLVRGTIPFVY